MAFNGRDIVRSKIITGKDVINKFVMHNIWDAGFLFGESDVYSKMEKFNYHNGGIKITLENKVNKDTLLKFYKGASNPRFTRGSETWCIIKQMETLIQTAEMRFLRSVAGYCLNNRKRNSEIRNELNIFELNGKIRGLREIWKTHVDRLWSERLPK
ncbi:uncharacterized protein LOC142330896 [Lycorma delicatula]|uniref:uncharacterized protein LOC142330896 n=1 Tax=Lycorma delicatula TaxID=130591 RepID=UPI003F519FC3